MLEIFGNILDMFLKYLGFCKPLAILIAPSPPTLTLFCNKLEGKSQVGNLSKFIKDLMLSHDFINVVLSFWTFEYFLTLCAFKCDKCDFTFTWISHLERAVTWCLTPLYSNFNCWVKPNFIRNELKPLCQAELKDIELKRVRTDEQWRW